jgi:hypothetical protein
MNQMACPRCRWLVPVVPFCQHCGAMLPRNSSHQAQSGLTGWWRKTSAPLRAVIIIGVVFLSGAIAVGIIKRQTERRGGIIVEHTAPPKPSPEINAEVRFTGSQFIIKNTDSYDWTNVKMEINGGLLSGGYELNHRTIKAGQTYTVGAMQFADSDGKRFNPFQMKPQKFVICGETPNGRTCYTGGWN